MASGITDFETSEAAQETVEHLLLSFEEHPSMSKGTLKQYMPETNERLLNGSHAHWLKASVIMIVTDYEKFRYAAAGDIDGAQKAYLDAINLSDSFSDRAQINQALVQVSQARDKKALEEKTSAEALKKQFDDATDYEIKGDKSFDAGDYLAAQVYYMTAIEKFGAPVDTERVKVIQGKFDAARSKNLESRGTKIEAEGTEQRARNLYADKNYTEAKAAATKAEELYITLDMKSKVDEMNILIEQIATDATIADTLK